MLSDEFNKKALLAEGFLVEEQREPFLLFERKA